MPGGKTGLQELLKVVLSLGDGVARNTIHRLLQQDEESWLAQAPAGEGETENDTEAWQQLESRLANAAPSEAAVQSLPETEQTYHALVRSCATLARYAVLLATWRLIDQGHTDGVNLDRLPSTELSQVEGWMKAVAHADLRRLFLNAPAALRFLVHNPQVRPSRIPEELDAAGLLLRKGGKPWEIHYSPKATHPYSATGVNLVN